MKRIITRFVALIAVFALSFTSVYATELDQGEVTFSLSNQVLPVNYYNGANQTIMVFDVEAQGASMRIEDLEFQIGGYEPFVGTKTFNNFRIVDEDGYNVTYFSEIAVRPGGTYHLHNTDYVIPANTTKSYSVVVDITGSNPSEVLQFDDQADHIGVYLMDAEVENLESGAYLEPQGLYIYRWLTLKDNLKYKSYLIRKPASRYFYLRRR